MFMCSQGVSAAGLARSVTLPIAAACLVVFGCGHHRADQYSYAPPYAPPVYPQPQAAAPQVGYPPVAFAATGMPAGAMPVGAMPAGGVPAGVVVGGVPAVGGMVVTAGGECPPCSPQGMEGGVVGASAMVEGGGQTPPCPPGP